MRSAMCTLCRHKLKSKISKKTKRNRRVSLFFGKNISFLANPNKINDLALILKKTLNYVGALLVKLLAIVLQKCVKNKHLNKNFIAFLDDLRENPYYSPRLNHGGMVEWLKAPVLKTGEGLRPPRVRIPIPPPSNFKNREAQAWRFLLFDTYKKTLIHGISVFT